MRLEACDGAETRRGLQECVPSLALCLFFGRPSETVAYGVLSHLSTRKLLSRYFEREPEPLRHLLSSKFKVGTEASGAAGPVGRQASAGTDWKMKAEILTYSRARGLFAGVNLNGASIKQDRDETAVLYGKIIPFQTILSGKVRAPSSSRTFLSAVRKYSNVAAERKQGE